MKSLALLASWLWAGAAVAGQFPGASGLMPEAAAESRLEQAAGEPPAATPARGLRKGKVHVELWASDIQYANLAVKFGGGPFYVTLLSGFEPGRDSRFSFGLGVGGHLTLGHRFWLDGDVTGGGVQPVQKPLEGDGGNVLAQVRLMLGFQVLPRLALFAGPTYNAWFVWGQPDFDSITRMSVSQSEPKPDQRLQHWPGLQVGLHI
ncbi:peptidase [Pyxidicoccus parkwayensis]|uniref:Peptidase n=1 Tax=Pyxidicoccus parkwayensis TaxID=2813578 RepID=A0ABX7NQM6_9BACT|nr:peptidase [Pyxidicoccus parkwaysis]QSQ21162.1 peptidase [Pyxidicoccus parkwaysis]